MAQITFNLWYRLSEVLYQRNNDDLNAVFRPYIERLIRALCKHCQMEPDHVSYLEFLKLCITFFGTSKLKMKNFEELSFLKIICHSL